MRQIAEWLANIGLERYAPVFIDNDIDVEVLRYLTDTDLEKIGVSLGHRRKLLAAIAEPGGGAATPAQSPVNRALVRSICAPHYRWRSSIIRSVALSKPRTSSPTRSKVFHRHRSFSRLRKRKNVSTTSNMLGTALADLDARIAPEHDTGMQQTANHGSCSSPCNRP